ncbi:ICAM5 protein, partial [Zosterops hypoxanthus]|nr:ICAM5 protein [Zosterops hypoxanthus]
YSIISLPLSHLFPPSLSQIFPHPHLFFSPQTVKPHLDTLTCPTHQNWTEGQEETLNCRAGGRPRPQIVCSKGQESLDTESSRRAHRGHAGVYRCRATNELGTAERNVTIWVIC